MRQCYDICAIFVALGKQYYPLHAAGKFRERRAMFDWKIILVNHHVRATYSPLRDSTSVPGPSVLKVSMQATRWRGWWSSAGRGPGRHLDEMLKKASERKVSAPACPDSSPMPLCRALVGNVLISKWVEGLACTDFDQSTTLWISVSGNGWPS